MATKKYFCEDCGLSSFYHLSTWFDGLIAGLPKTSSSRIESLSNLLMEKFFVFLGLASWGKDFDLEAIEPRTALFIKEIEKRGFGVSTLISVWGATGHFKTEKDGKVFRFDGLPTFPANRKLSLVMDDKEKAKRRLESGGFPVAPSRSFWFWEKRRAIVYAGVIGFPVVVKPRHGSVARHVTTDIKGAEELKRAMKKALAYEPAFIIEKYLDGFVHRATVIDGAVFCVRQLPANVAGDGRSSVKELIERKNTGRQKSKIFHPIVVDGVTEMLLASIKYDLGSIPSEGEVVFLQKDSFVRLGGDLQEVTPSVHEENKELFQSIARRFGARVVGIDFIVEDISRSFKNQTCAVLELNSLPCLELHHFPSAGEPTNVAGAVADLFLKYHR